MISSKHQDLLNGINDREVIEVCQALVRIKSVNPPGSERAIAEFAAGYLNKAGLQVELIEHGAERASVLARLKGSGELPGVLCSAHLDTVPVGVEKWIRDPFSGDLEEGKVWGRGSADMKGGMAAMMAAGKALVEAGSALRGDLILAFTAGEEVDSLGAAAVAKRQDILPLQAILVSEPSDNEVFIAEKGALWLQIDTYGQTAHGSMPHLGHNALMMMVRLIYALEELNVPFQADPLLGDFSRSFNTIAGGVATNVVPDRCTLTVDMRTVPGQDHRAIVDQFEGVIAALKKQDSNFRATLSTLNDRPPVRTDSGHPAVRRFIQVLTGVTGQAAEPAGVRYYTDASTYIPAWKDVPMIICGPGQAGQAHQPNEFVEISKLTDSVKIYLLALLEFLT